MKSVESLERLMKIAQTRLDEQKQIIQGWETKLTHGEAHLVDLKGRRQREVQEASKNRQGGLTLDAYLLKNQRDQTETEKHINNCKDSLVELYEEMRELYQELKTYEIVYKQQLQELKMLLKKREQHKIDEVAQHRRRSPLKTFTNDGVGGSSE